MPQSKKNRWLKVVIASSVMIAIWAAFLSSKSWIMWLLLFIPAAVCAEFLGTVIFAKWSWDRLSVEHSGFSILRIVLGVVSVLAFFVLVLVGRLILSRLFY